MRSSFSSTPFTLMLYALAYFFSRASGSAFSWLFLPAVTDDWQSQCDHDAGLTEEPWWLDGRVARLTRQVVDAECTYGYRIVSSFRSTARHQRLEVCTRVTV